jgi:cytochrome d ubiquinol oxidase subunit I
VDATALSRIQFAFTVTFHYLFPPFTMGLALLLVLLKTQAVVHRDGLANQSVRFWSRLFGVTFVMGVVTGIPLEFQFGTNWAQFSAFSGNVIAQTLAMEGMFAFFLESAFVGLLLFGERRFGQTVHWLSALMVFLGTWISGYFIVTTNAWMQHPVGFEPLPDGGVAIANIWALLFNPWVAPQYLHTMGGAVLTAAFSMAGLGAYYLLLGQQLEQAWRFVRMGVLVGLLASVFQLTPSGDLEGRQVTYGQPTKLAAMEGLFHTQQGAGIVILGQPNTETLGIDNAIEIPGVLSFLTYRRWNAQVLGLDAVPRDQWPQAIELLYYSYHIMVGLGTLFIALMAVASFMWWRGTLRNRRSMLWLLLLATPFPFIANTAGWMTTELGRQPWLIYGLLRIEDGVSPLLSSGNVLFTLLGFAGMYAVASLLYVLVMAQLIARGPAASDKD